MSSPESGSKSAVGPVIDLSRSPHAAMRPIPLDAVQLTDDFWAPRLKINREVTIPSQLRHCEETGRIDNFRVASGRKQGEFQGIYFNDSDVYKWLEAASFSLATHPDPKLEANVDAVIDEVAAAQQPDGYLNTYFMGERAKDRFTNLKDMHEIYCAGHLFQAAVAHHRATGKASLLDVACRFADHLYDVFGPGKRVGACGHEEAEMGLVELTRTTGEARYLELAHLMIEARGQKPPFLGGSLYHQDHLRFTEQDVMIGHAVRHLYLCCGAADVAIEKEPTDYLRVLNMLWTNFTQKQMYVTGGAGSRYEGEAFGADYELPNDRAYAETCAAIGSVMWNWRMLHLSGYSGCADLMELTLYNAVLPGLSLDGTRYFYQNPLADRGKHRRQEWFGCACCPPNVARMLASLPGYFYSTTEDAVLVHLYANGKATLALPNGSMVTVSQQTDYPWNGEITITAETTGADASLNLRIPGWATRLTLTVDGKPIPREEMINYLFDGYCPIPLEVGRKRTAKLSIEMPIERVISHSYVLGNLGRVALKRGPLIYCVEQADIAGVDVWDVVLPDESVLTPEFVPDLLGGITVLRGPTVSMDRSIFHDALYRSLDTLPHALPRPISLTAIPYYAWANRDPGPMQVWIPRA